MSPRHGIQRKKRRENALMECLQEHYTVDREWKINYSCFETQKKFARLDALFLTYINFYTSIAGTRAPGVKPRRIYGGWCSAKGKAERKVCKGGGRDWSVPERLI